MTDSLPPHSPNQFFRFLSKWWPALFAFAASFAFYSQFVDVLNFSVFQSRDFARAEEILRGAFATRGPELSGGGHLPGGFYYYFIAPFYALGGWYGVWLAFVFFMSLTATFVFQWALVLSNFWCALTVLGMWLANLALILNLTSFMNPTIIPFFYVLAFYFYLRSYSTTDARFWLSRFVTFFILSLATQLHGSTWVLVGSLYVFDFLERKRLPSRLIKIWAVSLIALTVPLLPFLILQSSLPTSPTLQSLSWSDKLYALFEWQKNLYLHTKPTLGSTLWYFFKSLFNILFFHILFLPFYFWARYKFGFSKKVPVDTPIMHKLLWVILATNSVNFFIYSQQNYLFRYALAFILSLVALSFLYTLPIFKRITVFRPALNLNFLTKLTSAIFVFALTLFGFRHWLMTNLRQDLTSENTAAALQYAWQTTGWNYEVFNKRFHIIRIWGERSFQDLYENIQKNHPVAAAEPAAVSGFFLLTSASDNFAIVAKIIEQNLPDDIRKLIATEDLKWVKPQKFESVWLVPYKLSEKSGFANLHNFGFSYREYDELKVLQAADNSTSGAVRIGPHDFLFYWNPTGGYFYHRTGIYVQIGPQNKLYFTVLGHPLSQNSRWTQPEWTESWQDLTARVWCDKTQHKLKVLSQVANMYHIIENDFQIDLLAPVTRVLETGCRGPIKKIQVGIGSLHVYGTGYNHQQLGSRHAEIEID